MTTMDVGRSDAKDDDNDDDDDGSITVGFKDDRGGSGASDAKEDDDHDDDDGSNTVGFKDDRDDSGASDAKDDDDHDDDDGSNHVGSKDTNGSKDNRDDSGALVSSASGHGGSSVSSARDDILVPATITTSAPHGRASMSDVSSTNASTKAVDDYMDAETPPPTETPTEMNASAKVVDDYMDAETPPPTETPVAIYQPKLCIKICLKEDTKTKKYFPMPKPEMSTNALAKDIAEKFNVDPPNNGQLYVVENGGSFIQVDDLSLINVNEVIALAAHPPPQNAMPPMAAAKKADDSAPAAADSDDDTPINVIAKKKKAADKNKKQNSGTPATSAITATADLNNLSQGVVEDRLSPCVIKTTARKRKNTATRPSLPSLSHEASAVAPPPVKKLKAHKKFSNNWFVAQSRKDGNGARALVALTKHNKTNEKGWLRCMENQQTSSYFNEVEKRLLFTLYNSLSGRWAATQVALAWGCTPQHLRNIAKTAENSGTNQRKERSDKGTSTFGNDNLLNGDNDNWDGMDLEGGAQEHGTFP